MYETHPTESWRERGVLLLREARERRLVRRLRKERRRAEGHRSAKGSWAPISMFRA